LLVGIFGAEYKTSNYLKVLAYSTKFFIKIVILVLEPLIEIKEHLKNAVSAQEAHSTSS
jgi:hypothetical protein